MGKHNEYFVEQRPDEMWVAKLPHAKRASAVESTQKKAIEAANRFSPEGVVHVKQPNGKFRKA